MGSISGDTFKRLYVLTLVGRFPRGAFGHVRLQKVNFFTELDSDTKPYAIHYHHHGQFSQELGDALEVLLSMNYLSATPLDSREDFGGNRYAVRFPEAYNRARALIAAARPSLVAAIDKAVTGPGMLPQDELLKKAYTYLEERGLSPGDLVLEEDAPEVIEVPGLSEDECEDLEMALAPGLVQGARGLVAALETASLNLDEVPTIELRAAGS